MLFRHVHQDELEAVYNLYRSVLGSPYCVWDNDYPGWYDINEDYEASTLFVLEDGGQIVGAISIIVHNELDALDFWQIPDSRELARVVVSPSSQGKGYAGIMVHEIASILKSEGIPSIHLLVAEQNIPAQRVYQRAGFQFRGKTFMFGHDYIGCELPL